VGEVDPVLHSGPLLSGLTEQLLEFGVRVVRIVVEEDHVARPRLVGELHHRSDSRVTPADVGSIFAVAILGIVQEHIRAVGDLVPADPVVRHRSEI
jgi:hypothetical protein